MDPREELPVDVRLANAQKRFAAAKEALKTAINDPKGSKPHWGTLFKKETVITVAEVALSMEEASLNLLLFEKAYDLSSLGQAEKADLLKLQEANSVAWGAHVYLFHGDESC